MTPAEDFARLEKLCGTRHDAVVALEELTRALSDSHKALNNVETPASALDDNAYGPAFRGLREAADKIREQSWDLLQKTKGYLDAARLDYDLAGSDAHDAENYLTDEDWLEYEASVKAQVGVSV